MDGGFAAYEDGFTALELTRKYYREADLDERQLDLLVRLVSALGMALTEAPTFAKRTWTEPTFRRRD